MGMESGGNSYDKSREIASKSVKKTEQVSSTEKKGENRTPESRYEGLIWGKYKQSKEKNEVLKRIEAALNIGEDYQKKFLKGIDQKREGWILQELESAIKELKELKKGGKNLNRTQETDQQIIQRIAKAIAHVEKRLTEELPFIKEKRRLLNKKLGYTELYSWDNSKIIGSERSTQDRLLFKKVTSIEELKKRAVLNGGINEIDFSNASNRSEIQKFFGSTIIYITYDKDGIKFFNAAGEEKGKNLKINLGTGAALRTAILLKKSQKIYTQVANKLKKSNSFLANAATSALQTKDKGLEKIEKRTQEEKRQKQNRTSTYNIKSTVDKNTEREKIEKKQQEREKRSNEQENKYKSEAELQERNNDSKFKESLNITEEKKSNFMQEIDKIPQTEIVKNIPKESFKNYIKDFIESEDVKKLNFSREKLSSLITQLFSKDSSNKDLLQLQTARRKSPIREIMLEKEQEKIKQLLKEQGEQTALESRKLLIERLGIKIGKTEVIERPEGKSYYKYTDINNPKITYHFTPATGEFSMSTDTINTDSRSIDISGDKQIKLLQIPSYIELMNQADPKTILLEKRTNTYKEFSQAIKKKLEANIHHSLSDTEASIIKNEIQKKQLENSITSQIKAGLGLKKNTFNKNADLGYYTLLSPILRTFNQPNLSINQLKILKQFADRIAERGQHTNGKSPTETNEIIQYTDFKNHIATPRNLIKYALSGEQIREVESFQNNRDKSRFTIGKLMGRLEKSGGRGGPEDKILDIEKIATLVNLRESPDITKNKEYQTSYNNFLGDVERQYLQKQEPKQKQQDEAEANAILQRIQKL